jgi:succinate dehydrogenase / fumarate reductase cytochrome b subunit
MTPRPLSPHLQIYRPMLTMVMSIVHRITGAALYFGTILLVAWLSAAAAGPESFAVARNIAASIPGKVILLGYTWALVHHALGGIRHLLWDTGRGLDIPTVERMAQLNLAGSIIITILIWFLAWL